QNDWHASVGRHPRRRPKLPDDKRIALPERLQGRREARSVVFLSRGSVALEVPFVHPGSTQKSGLTDENGKLDEAQRLFLRIGINVGDVMMKDGDIFGDGVNIAARLESLAEPGGICVSRGVRDHLRKHPIAFEDLGEQKVRNIAQPVRAFKVRMGGAPDDKINPILESTRVDGPSMAPTPLGEDVGVELAFWDSIKDSGSVAELDAYLKRYPDGPFNVLARTRRDALIAVDESALPAKEDTLAVELAFWEAAKDSGSPVEI